MIKRYSGSSAVEVASRRRFTGAGWAALSFGRRWNGSAWVDLWDDAGSEGDSGDGSGGSGVLFRDLKSTVSRPTVHYSGSYEVTASVVILTFKGWLASSAGWLGNGIQLTVFARLNGGEWHSALLKPSASVWNDGTKHAASLTLSGEVSGRAKIELYVTRTGSGYGGSAGNLGSAKSPKRFMI